MAIGFHWFDLIPLLMLFVLFILLVAGLAAVGLSIGAGYAWMRHRLEQRA